MIFFITKTLPKKKYIDHNGIYDLLPKKARDNFLKSYYKETDPSNYIRICSKRFVARLGFFCSSEYIFLEK